MQLMSMLNTGSHTHLIIPCDISSNMMQKRLQSLCYKCVTMWLFIIKQLLDKYCYDILSLYTQWSQWGRIILYRPICEIWDIVTHVVDGAKLDRIARISPGRFCSGDYVCGRFCLAFSVCVWLDISKNTCPFHLFQLINCDQVQWILCRSQYICTKYVILLLTFQNFRIFWEFFQGSHCHPRPIATALIRDLARYWIIDYI